MLIAYGDVMRLVHEWEASWGVLWWRTQRKHPSRPSGDFDTARSQREVFRLERALQRKTIQDLRHDVGTLLDPEVAADLEDLIEHRNRLAHRFLREQAAPESGDDYKPGTHKELVWMMGRFMRSYQAAMKMVMALPGYDGPVPEHWPAVAERIVNRAFAGQQIPRDSRLQ